MTNTEYWPEREAVVALTEAIDTLDRLIEQHEHLLERDDES
jgi:hypothetical protein